MVVRTIITFILFSISIFGMAAQQQVKTEFHYGNLDKYLKEAIELIEEGDFSMGKKKLIYAQKSMDKLIVKGYEATLKNEAAQIRLYQDKITKSSGNPPLSQRTTLVEGSNTTATDLNSIARSATKKIMLIKEVFSQDPSHIHYNIPEETRRILKDFNRTSFLKICQQAQADPAIKEPQYRRQAKELQAVIDFMSHLDEKAKTAGVFTKIDRMVEKIKKYSVNAETFETNTKDYLLVLMALMPKNQVLKKQYQTVQHTAYEVRIEQQKAVEKAAAQRKEREKAKTKAAKAAAKAESALPVAGLKNATLEAEFKSIGQAAIGRSFTIQQIIITASQWGITKDALGRPISRSMITYAIGKDSQGQCYKQAMTFTQKASGNNYGRTYYDSGWSYTKKKIDCQ